MRLVLRIARIILVAAMLLVLPALYGLSYYRSATLLWLRSGQPSFVVISDSGFAMLAVMAPSATVDAPPSFDLLIDRVWDEPPLLRYFDDFDKRWSFAGVETYSGVLEADQPRGKFQMLRIPYWMPCVPLALLMFTRLRRAGVTWSRRRRGCCLQCGYDLRASTSRCPECGTVVSNS